MNLQHPGLLAICLFFLVFAPPISFCQVNFTANDAVVPYGEPFRANANFGAYVGFDEVRQATLAYGGGETGIPGVGIKALRPGLFEDLLAAEGYASRVPLFEQFEQIGLSEHILIVGFPSDQHRDPNFYCPTNQSTLFANMYEPIWDDGANGTPYNDDNYYAAYIYQTAELYKDHIRFWEIWNEPGFDYTGGLGWLPPEAPNSWWNNDPEPCDYKLRAPIQHFVRMLRISWEVIKTVDPDSYVTLSGLGYPSFLDAILRNTDNPNGGGVTPEFPLGGGAYFDAIGYHSYPHFDGSVKRWNNDTQSWEYSRHSDGAAAGIASLQGFFKDVLVDYGYDGQQFPEKNWIITEANIPRREFGDFMGSDLAQRNFMIKGPITCIKNKIHQWSVYKLAEDAFTEDATFEFDLMGLYQHPRFQDGIFQKRNESGIALATFTQLTEGLSFDDAATQQLNLPTGADGAVFRDSYGNTTYVVWAITQTDRSEQASATWNLPASLTGKLLRHRQWDYNATDSTHYTQSAQIQLTSTPVFISTAQFTKVGDNCINSPITFTSIEAASRYAWSANGGTGTGTGDTYSWSATLPGNYAITLERFNAQNERIGKETYHLRLDEPPFAAFDTQSSGPIVQFFNQSSENSTTFAWDFGDNTSSSDPSPYHVYFQGGDYSVQLTATNVCGSSEADLMVNSTPPSPPTISTANDAVPAYLKPFILGVNMTFFQNWSNEQLGDIAAGIPDSIIGVGARSTRSILGEYFVNSFWGYDVQKPMYQHYNNLNLQDNVLTIGFPGEASRDPFFYCADFQSELFKDIYVDIWDGGANGTPVNEANPYALYVYQLVERYKDNITFWEVLNSPDFDDTGDLAWLPRGEPGNWWENNPEPCDYALKAPVYHYVRLLRITYEIVKTLDPESYVTIAGISYPSFLDAVLRNSDNPQDGSVASGYPLLGGAYFDAIGFKTFPHFDGSTFYYDVDLGGFVYERHSDAAANGMQRIYDEFADVLHEYGYDNTQFPAKEWILSEANVPRKSIGNQLGGEEVQRNWLLKAAVVGDRIGIRQLNVFRIAETEDIAFTQDAQRAMGLYATLDNVQPGDEAVTESGMAAATYSRILGAAHYDAIRSAALNLPARVDGAAYRHADGSFTYVLWAKTTLDNDETASANYTFPATLGVTNLTARQWDFAHNPQTNSVSSSAIALTQTPVFLSENSNLHLLPLAKAEVTSSALVCTNETIQLSAINSLNSTDFTWRFPGGSPATASGVNTSVAYPDTGSYTVYLEARNANGSHTAYYEKLIVVRGAPVASFDYLSDGRLITFTNTSQQMDSVWWDFGNGQTNNGFYPAHLYSENGTYTVRLIAYNACGNDTTEKTIVVSNAPTALFSYQSVGDCDAHQLQFMDASIGGATRWAWTFEAGVPATSSIQNPTVTFPNDGTYAVQLIIENDGGIDTTTQQVLITNGAVTLLTDRLCAEDSVRVGNSWFHAGFNQGQVLMTNATAAGCDSTVIVNLTFKPPVQTRIDTLLNPGDLVVIGGQSFAEPGTFTVPLTAVNGCDSTLLITIDWSSATDNQGKKVLNWQLSPNPATDFVNLELNLPQTISCEVLLIDPLGRPIAQILAPQRLSAGTYQWQYPTEQLVDGRYFVLFRQGNQQTVAPLVIIR